MKKKNNSKLPTVLSVIALILAVIALANSLNVETITGKAIGTTDLRYDGGKVGIGTDPAQLFHVAQGDALFEDDVVIEDNLDVQDELTAGDLMVSGVGVFDNVSTVDLYVNGTAIEDIAAGVLDLSGYGGDIAAGDIASDSVSTDSLGLTVVDTLPICDSGSEGLIQLYNNSGSLVLDVCFEDVWVEIGPTAP